MAFPTHEIAGDIQRAARGFGFLVKRHAASPASRSVYLTCDEIKIRIADHETSRLTCDIDVHTDQPRPGSVDRDTAIAWLRGRHGRHDRRGARCLA